MTAFVASSAPWREPAELAGIVGVAVHGEAATGVDGELQTTGAPSGSFCFDKMYLRRDDPALIMKSVSSLTNMPDRRLL